MITLTKLGFLVLLTSLWLPSTAAAVRPRGTTMVGVIQSVDHSARWIVFTQDGGPVRRFVYSAWANFGHGHIDISPSHLLPGMRVQIDLHNPFFGEDYVTRIVLIDPLREVGGERQQVKPQPFGGFPVRGGLPKTGRIHGRVIPHRRIATPSAR